MDVRWFDERCEIDQAKLINHNLTLLTSFFFQPLLFCHFRYIMKFSGCTKVVLNFFFFFLKVFGGHMSFFGATGTPVLDFWWRLLWVSKPEWVLLIRYFCGGECNVHSPRFTSGATLANLLAAGAQPVTSPHACAEVGLGSDSNVQPHEQKTNALPLCQWPG